MDRQRVFLLAGEPSGDMLGGRLMQALRDQAGEVEFFGVGGPRMAERGLHSQFPMAELSLIGITEILPHLPRLIYRLGQLLRAVRRIRPDVVLTIDCPSFALHLQRHLRGLPLMRIHYVAPQMWAWRQGRTPRLARDIDHLLTLLPFEPPFFQRHGIACSFVGHPIIEEASRCGDGARFRRRNEIPADAPLVCLLPGSRESEVARHLPILEGAVMALWRTHARLRVVLPTVGGVAGLVKRAVLRWKIPVLVLEDRSERFDAYAASWVAIAASGTVSLETALAGLPVVTIYRTGPVTGWLARRLIQVPHVNLVNLILGRPAVPELLQEDCRPDRIAMVAGRLLDDDALRAEQGAALAEAVARLAGDDDQPPSQRAAARILELLTESRRRTTP
jgi:lipid-A-disaccharide synthase